jgi:hypothetical protein
VNGSADYTGTFTLLRDHHPHPQRHTVVWPSGADFDPAILHDRPEHEAAFKAAAQRWSKSAAVA